MITIAIILLAFSLFTDDPDVAAGWAVMAAICAILAK